MINTAVSPRYKIRLTPHQQIESSSITRCKHNFSFCPSSSQSSSIFTWPLNNPYNEKTFFFFLSGSHQQVTLTWCSCWCCDGTFETTIFHAIQQASPCSCNTSLTPQTVSDLNKVSHSTLLSSLMTSSQHLRKVSSSSPI